MDHLLDTLVENAAQNPNAIAVSFGSDQLSHGQLCSRAQACTEALRSRGVAPGDLVGISLPRGLELAIAVLGVMNAGAAYLPLDTAYPIKRLQLMVADSGISTCICEGAFLDDISDQVVGVEPQEFSAGAAGFEREIHNTNQLIYVIYTSGSTGRPKGVALGHSALATLINWQIEQPGFSSAGRVLQFTPLSFDVHFQELFATWATGGEVVMIDEEQRSDPIKLLRLLDELRIEGLYLPFAALSQLAEASNARGEAPQHLKRIVTAGQQLKVTLQLQHFFDRIPSCRLFNQYGPSETHVVTSYSLPEATTTWPILPSIGKPISNSRIVLVDSDQVEVGLGEPGEILALGNCLAEGYWNNPALTAEKFVQFGNERGYLTGDLAKLDAAGNLEYLGRLDSQVKIRGYRIEPGEIESVVVSNPRVADCAISVLKNSFGEQSLVCFLVPADQPSVPTEPSSAAAQVDHWRNIWDGSYATPDDSLDIDAEFDITGWNDSYTGNQLPKSEMQAWVDGTKDRILSLKPNRVLEIGSGTGLILFAVAPHCQRYLGCDYSQVAVEKLNLDISRLEKLSPIAQSVQLEASAVATIEEKFDTIVLNSLTQHLPSLDYLSEVIRNSIELLDGDGYLFIGDVTSATTRAIYYSTVACSRASQDTDIAEMRNFVTRSLGDEQELVIHPGWFYQLPEDLAAIVDVDIQLKPGDYVNELRNFRFDVVLTISKQDHLTQAKPLDQAAWDVLDWADVGPSASNVERLLNEPGFNGLKIIGVPNPRVTQPALEWQTILQADSGVYGDIIGRTQSLQCVDTKPDRFWQMGSDKGLQTQTVLSSEADKYDVLFHRKGSVMSSPYPSRSINNFADESSKPYQSALFPSLTRELDLFLEERLPIYMVPSRYVQLHKLPLTPSGKVDYRKLPTPSSQRPNLAEAFVAPRSDLESSIAKIWRDALELDSIGVHDNFFEAGGTSLLSLRVIISLNEVLGSDLSVVHLFQYPTIEQLTAHIQNSEQQSGLSIDVARTRAQKNKQAQRNRRSRLRKT